MPPSLPERYNDVMAKRFLTSLRLVNLSSDPVSASNGDVYYNSSVHKTKIYQNGSWTTIPSSLSDLSDVSASAASNDQVLTYNSVISKWQSKNLPAAQVGVGTSLPEDPAEGELFFNITSNKLYFYYETWNEISFIRLDLDGGTSSTTEFDQIIDGGNASTIDFTSGTYSGGSSSTVF